MKKASLLLVICSYLSVLGQAGFVSRLLEKKPDQAMEYTNLQEYYGRYKGPDGSESLLVMLLSYEYATETIRFHFNMKDPGYQGDEAFMAETDLQWNSQLNLKKEEDAIMVDTERE